MFFILPYGNDRQTSRYPAVTYTLIAINVAVFIWMLPLNQRSIATSLGLLPGRPDLSDIVTSMFIHAGLLHLGWNMLFLWLFGPNVEDALGRLGYTIFYFGSGLAAALLHIFVVCRLVPAAALIPMVGASGAIAGILGLFAIRFYKTNIKIFWSFVIVFWPLRWGTFTVPAILGLGVWFLTQLYGGMQSFQSPMSGGVAYWSHIGGMMFGMLLATVAHMGAEGSNEYLMADVKSDIESGTTGNAIHNLRILIQRDPDNADAHAKLGKLYADEMNPHEAVPCFRRAIELYLSRNERDKAARRYDEMRECYRDACLDLRSEFQIARYLMEVCSHKPAVRMFQNICLNHPEAPEAEVALMKAGDICLDGLDDPQRAIWCYERFLCTYPHSTYRTMVEKSLDEARKKML